MELEEDLVADKDLGDELGDLEKDGGGWTNTSSNNWKSQILTAKILKYWAGRLLGRQVIFLKPKHEFLYILTAL